MGSGKSTISKWFSEQGIPVFDADQTVQILYTDQHVQHCILRHLSIENNDRIHFKSLILSHLQDDPKKLSDLEEFLHPLIRKKEDEFFNQHQNASLVICDVPLLFETNSQSRYDGVLALIAPQDVLWERVKSRPNMTERKFIWLLSKQMPQSKKIDLSQWVLDTSSSLSEIYKILQQWLEEGYRMNQKCFAPSFETKWLG